MSLYELKLFDSENNLLEEDFFLGVRELCFTYGAKPEDVKNTQAAFDNSGVSVTVTASDDDAPVDVQWVYGRKQQILGYVILVEDEQTETPGLDVLFKQAEIQVHPSMKKSELIKIADSLGLDTEDLTKDEIFKLIKAELDS